MLGILLTHGAFSEEKLSMAKNLFKAKFENKLPLGGIATGHISLGCDGAISLPWCESSNLSFFAVKAEKDGELLDARVLQSSQNKHAALPCFESSDAYSYFPFAEISFSDGAFPAEISLTAFSPFIPLNDTDSGIPAVCFEIEFKNTSDERTDFSVCLVSSNVNENARNRMGCTDTGEAYIHLSGTEQNSKNTCIATNSKNISFCEYVSVDGGFADNFTKNLTLYNKTKAENPEAFSGGALCTHFSLGSNESKKVTFCLSWYSAENNFSRNYYAQYFESSLECASYCFRQFDRLKGASMELCENIMGATLTDSVKQEINTDLFAFSGKEYTRLDDGTLISDDKVDFSDMNSFILRSDVLSCLFPSLDYSQTEHFYRESLYEKAKDTDIALAILKSYRRYVLSADTDSLIEDWYYVVKCMEKLFDENGNAKCRADELLLNACPEAASQMAEAVKDKKRHEAYLKMLENKPLSQFFMDICSGFAKINEISGFEYNAIDKHIGFYPDSNSCPLDTGNTFRCFFCTPTCFGYVEEGIDYIEINLLFGSLTVRSFGVPRIPRLVQYGGRNWRFENKNLVAHLDSDLEITPHKKLTIFIDIKQ